ncbi:zinc metalloproteinase nas-4-like [Cherax quadricarinatus]|uniref:zinc metalloproteinase nas-4-like n=1 Tax=Cherax quadricarinatus TaxID=27406 RepID=UPI00387E77DE
MKYITTGALVVLLCVAAEVTKAKKVELPKVIIGNPNNIEAYTVGAPISEEEITNARHMRFRRRTKLKDPIAASGYFEGDIMVSSEEELSQIIQGDPQRQLSAISNSQKVWPNAVIPYVISNEFTSSERCKIARAIDEFQSRTCLRFVPRTTQEDYVFILKGQECSSWVGRSGGVQVVSLGQGCVQFGVILHELMHAAGFWHEQSRSDRDQYVVINWNNIKTGKEDNFKMSYTVPDELYLPYDYDSVMHYGAFEFARSYSSPTIVPRQKGVNIGQRSGFSQLDVKGLNLLYKCESPQPSTPKPPSPETPTPEHCQDHSQYCLLWARGGSCTTNPYVNLNCRKTCSLCDVKVCADLNVNCAFWASNGECALSQAYMHDNCAKACGVC